MSPSWRPAYLAIISFPRVSGDEPLADERAAIYRVFSPRERG